MTGINVSIDPTAIDPKAALENHLKVLLTQQLQGDSNKIVERLVSEALGKRRDVYSSQTVLDDILGREITNLVSDMVRSAIEQRSDQIRVAVLARLDDAFFEQLIAKISTGITENLEITFKLTR